MCCSGFSYTKPSVTLPGSHSRLLVERDYQRLNDIYSGCEGILGLPKIDCFRRAKSFSEVLRSLSVVATPFGIPLLVKSALR
jgi:hypothetical protein